MMRLELALSFAMLASFSAPPPVSGQDSASVANDREKADPAAGTKASEATEDLLSGLDAGVSSAFELIQSQDQPVKAETEAIVNDLQKTFDPSLPDSIVRRPRDQFRAEAGGRGRRSPGAARTSPDQGVVVIAVKPGSLAEHAGLKLNDVFVSLGDQKATDVAMAKKILLGLGKDALEVKLIREGKPSRMSLVGPDHGFPPESAAILDRRAGLAGRRGPPRPPALTAGRRRPDRQRCRQRQPGRHCGGPEERHPGLDRRQAPQDRPTQ